MRILFLSYWLFISLFLSAQEKRYSFSRQKMGSPFGIILYASDSLQATTMANAGYALVDSLNDIFSDYIPQSELNRLGATSGTDSFVAVSSPLFEIFLLAEEAWKNSKGRFDITIGPLSRVWRRARKENVFPDPDSIQKAKAKSGWDKLILDRENHQVKLLNRDMQLDLGGIAAGYIAQQVTNFFTREGIRSALIDASGDIVCTNAPPGKQGWVIGINQPNERNKLLEKSIEIRNVSVSTSGDVFQFIEYKGRKYSHIIDPRTGYGVNFQRNVTVISKDGTKADWLATVFSIMPLCKVKKLAKKMNASFLITQIKKGKFKQYTSRDFRNYWQKTS